MGYTPSVICRLLCRCELVITGLEKNRLRGDTVARSEFRHKTFHRTDCYFIVFCQHAASPAGKND